MLAALEPELTEDQKLVLSILDARAIRPFSQPTDIGNLPELGQIGQRL